MVVRTLVIPALRGWGQENQNFKGILSCVAQGLHETLAQPINQEVGKLTPRLLITLSLEMHIYSIISLLAWEAATVLKDCVVLRENCLAAFMSTVTMPHFRPAGLSIPNSLHSDICVLASAPHLHTCLGPECTIFFFQAPPK